MKIPELNELTLKEKISLVCGDSFWSFGSISSKGIVSLRTSDGPHGLRNQVNDKGYFDKAGSFPAICYPVAASAACSFDPDLLYEMGRAIGKECVAQGVAVLLGPGINIKRHPLCGRNFEYYSEDPILSGTLGAAFIRGVQSCGVSACVKHFAGNSQEMRRLVSNSVIDEKTLRDIYLKAFEIAVKKGKPSMVMAAYNMLNGEYCCENKRLLTQILRDEWEFEGCVVSDWGAVNDIEKSMESGLDLEMPGKMSESRHFLEHTKKEEVIKGIERAAGNILGFLKKHALLEKKRIETIFDHKKCLRLAERIAEESIVLLKNEGNLLPLQSTGQILLIGQLAKFPRYQGSGSSKVNLSEERDPLTYLKKEFPDAIYEEGYSLTDDPKEDELYLQKALAAAKNFQKILLFTGLPEVYEAEGYDRKDISLPKNQLILIEELAKLGKEIVIVNQAGAATAMPWQRGANAIVMCYPCGSAFGSALTRVLTGEVAPSGKLAETIPIDLKDISQIMNYPADRRNIEYQEERYSGYRFYRHYKKEVCFPFGHGLSYTTFSYRDLACSWQGDGLFVTVQVKNTGECEGKETVQFYLAPENEPDDCVLKGFSKVCLIPGEEKTVSIKIDADLLYAFDPSQTADVIKSGRYVLFAGASCEDLRLSAEFEIDTDLKKEVTPLPEDFDPYCAKREAFDRNVTIRDIESFIFFQPFIALLLFAGSKISKDVMTKEQMLLNIRDMPIRQLPMGTEGVITPQMCRWFVGFLNNFWKPVEDK